MENNSPRAQSAHCSSHFHYAALQPTARFATALPAAGCARARAHTHHTHRNSPRPRPGWVRSAGTGRGRPCRGLRGGGGGFGAGVSFQLGCCLFGAAFFEGLLFLISSLALFRFSGSSGLPRAHPGAWSSLGEAATAGVGSGKGAISAVVTRGSQPRHAALACSEEDTCAGETGKASRFPRRGSRSAPSPALWHSRTYPGVERDVRNPAPRRLACPRVRAKWANSVAPTLTTRCPSPGLHPLCRSWHRTGTSGGNEGLPTSPHPGLPWVPSDWGSTASPPALLHPPGGQVGSSGLGLGELARSGFLYVYKL